MSLDQLKALTPWCVADLAASGGGKGPSRESLSLPDT